MIEITDRTPILYELGKSYYVDFVQPDGLTSVRKRPFKEYMQERPNLVLVPYCKFEAITKKMDDADASNPWHEIDKERYWEMLELLPPEKWETTGSCEAFRMCEYWTSNITNHFFKINNRYFEGNRRTSQSYQDMATEIRAQFEF
jgi:hypothetical protein